MPWRPINFYKFHGFLDKMVGHCTNLPNLIKFSGVCWFLKPFALHHLFPYSFRLLLDKYSTHGIRGRVQISQYLTRTIKPLVPCSKIYHDLRQVNYYSCCIKTQIHLPACPSELPTCHSAFCSARAPAPPPPCWCGEF